MRWSSAANVVDITRFLCALWRVSIVIGFLAGAIFAEADLWVACEMLRREHLMQRAFVVCILMSQTKGMRGSLRLFLGSLGWQLG
jgi:hypothetical protein